MLVFREFDFAAAHQLPDYSGKCARLHGHTYKLQVGVGGPVDPKTGMVVDFGRLKNVVNLLLERKLDHYDLGQLLDNPTAENTALYIMDWLLVQWDEYAIMGKPVVIRLWESPRCFVEVKSDDKSLRCNQSS